MYFGHSANLVRAELHWKIGIHSLKFKLQIGFGLEPVGLMAETVTLRDKQLTTKMAFNQVWLTESETVRKFLWEQNTANVHSQ